MILTFLTDRRLIFTFFNYLLKYDELQSFVLLVYVMALKRSSEIITISGNVQNTTGGFTSTPVDLMLNPLDQEVFVVLAVQIDFLGAPPIPLVAAPLANSRPSGVNQVALSTTRPAAQLTMSESEVFGYAQERCWLTIGDSGGGTDQWTNFGVQEQSSDVPDSNLDYIHIIATSDFFVGTTDDPLLSSNLDVAYRIWGYRAKADAATYAALVQSEVLSS